MKNYLKKTLFYYLLWKAFRSLSLAVEQFRNRHWRSNDFVQKTLIGSAPRNGKVLCLFAHFEKNALLHPCDVHHLEALRRDLNCDIAFCSTHIDLENVDNAEALSRLTFLSVARANKGYDFGSWKTLLDAVGERLAEYDYLLLVNNSIFGPFFPLNSMPKLVSPQENVILGITESNEREPHLQSYFLFIPNRVFTGGAFKRFWDRLRFLDNKKNIVYAYEMGFSRSLRGAGVEPRALYPMGGDEMGNPTHLLWRQLVHVKRCPYVKRDILRSGSASQSELQELREWVNRQTQFDPHFIVP